MEGKWEIIWKKKRKKKPKQFASSRRQKTMMWTFKETISLKHPIFHCLQRSSIFAFINSWNLKIEGAENE